MNSSRLDTHLFLLVLVDHVVVAPRSMRARLSERDLLSGHVLQLDGNMLEDVTHPGPIALGEPPDESTRLAVGAGVVSKTGQGRDQRVCELRAELPGGPVFQRAEIDVKPDDREMGVQAGSNEYGFIQYQH